VIQRVPLAELHLDPCNARLHDDRNLDAIRGSLAGFGQQKPIVVDSASVIRAGNGTYLAAKSLGWETIDVVRTSLAGLDAAAFAIADNRTSDLSTFDNAALAKLLQELGKRGRSRAWASTRPSPTSCSLDSPRNSRCASVRSTSSSSAP
jgi:ParB-like chromosome segregation protein Spo0J